MAISSKPLVMHVCCRTWGLFTVEMTTKASFGIWLKNKCLWILKTTSEFPSEDKHFKKHTFKFL